jgi:hypothetical protein
MFWIRSGLHAISISDWLTAGPSMTPDLSTALEDARTAMLEALGDADAKKRQALAARIRCAPDIHSLWDLRPDVMMAVSHSHGEAEARKRLARATASFEAVLPQACALTSGRRRHAMHRRT